MTSLLLAFLLAADPAPAAAGAPVPPEAVFEPELTKAATRRAQVEVKAALVRLDRDQSLPASAKAELRKKIENLKVAVYTTPKSLDDTVAYFEQAIAAATFLFGERNLLEDAAEIARAGGYTVSPAAVESWTGKPGRSARWSQEDGSLEIDVEDHLVDPRDATIKKRTVVLVTSTK